MRLTRTFIGSFFWSFLFAGAAAQAATVTGTVTDKTTDKPAAGDAVVLLEPMSGMSEVGHATTDAKGRYSLNLPGGPAYLVRVTHQGAGYFIPAPEGGGAGDISVYDVAPKVSGVALAERVTGVESDNGQLRVVERYSIRNTSSPPTTQWSAKSFEVVLPADATLGDVSAQRPGAGSLPTSVKLDPDGAKGHYSFNFPIQPDEGGKGTLFQVQYTVPYSGGNYTFHSVVAVPAHTFWVVLPKAMTFAGGSGTRFQLSPQDPTVQTYLMQDAPAAQPIDYTVSGTGAFPREDQGAQGGGQGDSGQSGAAQGGPGGGLGTPINTPDPLSKYKWWILGGLGLLLVVAAAFLLRKPAGPALAMPSGTIAPGTTYSTPGVAAAPATKNGALMSVLKEELFAIESEKIAGTLSANDYAEQKAALETVLKRALKKTSL